MNPVELDARWYCLIAFSVSTLVAILYFLISLRRKHANISTTKEMPSAEGAARNQTMPNDLLGWTSLHFRSGKELISMGLIKWTDEIYLLPKEWYDHIPFHFPVVDLKGNSLLFEKGKTPRDHRFGALGFGVLSRSLPNANKKMSLYCKKGHVWEAGLHDVEIKFYSPHGLLADSGPLCPFCMAEHLSNTCKAFEKIRL